MKRKSIQLLGLLCCTLVLAIGFLIALIAVGLSVGVSSMKKTKSKLVQDNALRIALLKNRLGDSA
jgi:hypothetical protein